VLFGFFLPDMNALIIEGGALRSVFSAGLLDAFMSRNFYPFDFAIGVSAGAANLLFYLNRRQGQALQLYQQLSQQAEFINSRRFVSGGHLLDLDLLFSDQYQFADLRLQQTGNLLITMTDVISGQANYVDAAEPDFLDALKASMSLPVLYRHFPLYRGRPMTDGGVADGIPLREAIRCGATRIMVIRSRHHNYSKTDSLWHRYIRWQCRRHSTLVEVMQQRGALHERHKQLIRNPPDPVRVVDIAPPAEMSLGRFSKNSQQLLDAYLCGYHQAEDAMAKWQDHSNTLCC